jgi:hypothetical protein
MADVLKLFLGVLVVGLLAMLPFLLGGTVAAAIAFGFLVVMILVGLIVGGFEVTDKVRGLSRKRR